MMKIIIIMITWYNVNGRVFEIGVYYVRGIILVSPTIFIRFCSFFDLVSLHAFYHRLVIVVIFCIVLFSILLHK